MEKNMDTFKKTDEHENEFSNVTINFDTKHETNEESQTDIMLPIFSKNKSFSNSDNIDIDDVTEVSNKLTCSSERSEDTRFYQKDVMTQLVVARLWVVLLLTFMFTMLMLTTSYLTYSLTLRVEAFHAMYNLFTLFGSILAIKLCRNKQSLQNAFGWARIEVLTSLSALIFLGGLCFGVAVDSMQASFKTNDLDAIQHAGGMVWLGILGLLLNAFVYILIGGYSNHQGCQYERRGSGMWLKPRNIKRTISSKSIQTPKKSKFSICDIHHQSLSLVFRDITGLLMVVGCAGVVVWDNDNYLAKYIDPILALMSVAILLALSYPYARDCCHILLQTMPDHIELGFFSAQLLDRFPDVINVHNIHIWSLNPGKVVATAHVVLMNSKVYMKIGTHLRKFFHDRGIDHVTIQPEFLDGSQKKIFSVNSTGCLLNYTHSLCKENTFCIDGGGLSPNDTIDPRRKRKNDLNFDKYIDDKNVSDSENNIIVNSFSSDTLMKEHLTPEEINFHTISTNANNIPSRSVSCHFEIEKENKQEIENQEEERNREFIYSDRNQIVDNLAKETRDRILDSSCRSVPVATHNSTFKKA